MDVATAPRRSRALGILEDEVKSGFLDPDLVRVFIEARVFARPISDPMAM